MYKILGYVLLMMIFFSGSSILSGQFGDRANPFPGAGSEPDTSFNEADTLLNKGGFFSIFKGEPGKAALYSLIIPGGGQVYNRKWWKVPIAIGIDGVLAGFLVYNKKNYKNSQLAYQTALSEGASNISRLKQVRDYYRKQSEYGWIWLIAGHIATVADAYVDRHLMTFDVGDDLTLHRNLNYRFENPSVVNVGIVVHINTPSGQRHPKVSLSIW